MPATIPETRRRQLLVVLVLLALISTGVAVVVTRTAGHGRTAVAAHPRPPLLPAGGAPSPLTLTTADGRKITCPTGSAPTVMIMEATFTPALAGGSVMKKGSYHIRLRGTLDNETGAAVDVRKLIASVRGRFWPGARITAARTVDPQSSVRIVVDGAYRSDEQGPVRVATHLDWQWHASDLAGCGESGLVEDD